MADTIQQQLLALNRRLLEAIATGDWEIYSQLCDESISCFEPEAKGHLVEGMDFHRFYFDQGGMGRPCTTTMASPHVRLLGDDVAVVSCIRILQQLTADGTPKELAFEETRVWQRQRGTWRHVHFHRSMAR